MTKLLSLVAMSFLAATPLLAQGATRNMTSKPAVASSEFFLRNNDKPIVFLGDSITEQRMYTTLIESYVLSRFPTWNVTFRNVGWSGDGAPLWMRGGYDKGIARDILSLKPSSILINYGMNDARGGEGSYAYFIENSTRLVQDLKKSGARVALLTPSPEENYEANQPGGSAYNNTLTKYGNGLKEIAAKENILFVDQLSPFIKVIEMGRASGVLSKTNSDARFINDAVHPNYAGHMVMATSILKGLNAPSLVSSVSIDAKARKLTSQNATVKLISSTDAAAKDVISFTRLDNALPWPVPGDVGLALRIPGYSPLNDLSRYELKATNLMANSYDLSVDGKSVGTFSREDLGKGVNLSNNAGPVSEQTKQLLDRITGKNDMFYKRWREVQLYETPAWLKVPDVDVQRKAELARLDAQIATMETEINTLRKPVVHTWTLTPAVVSTP